MKEFVDALGPFVWGFALGYFWHPVWTILKKIYQEAKIAKTEWNKKSKQQDLF
jgi:hypothetical protein